MRRSKSLEYDCHYCHIPLDSRNVTIDHIVPRALGGQDERFNKILACRDCNERKADAFPSCRCNVCRKSRRIHWEKFRISESHNKRTRARERVLALR